MKINQVQEKNAVRTLDITMQINLTLTPRNIE